MPKENSRDVVFKDIRGGYVTRIQLEFFLNRKGSSRQLREFILSLPESPISNEFTVYYDTCRVYNTISDFIYSEQEPVEMFWNSEKEAMEFSYVIGGVLDRKIKRMLRT